MDEATELAGTRAVPEVSALSAVMQSCYPHLLGDLDVLRRLLVDLHADLTASPDTVARHSETLQQLATATRVLMDVRSAHPTRDELVHLLRSVLKQLGDCEDDLITSPETIARHGFKLQHVDMGIQLLTEVIVGAVTGPAVHPLTYARLQNLRACCSEALSPN